MGGACHRDFEQADRYIETFLVRSWAEHLCEHERTTKADREIEERLRTYVTRAPLTSSASKTA
jgi:hypothetical protein